MHICIIYGSNSGSTRAVAELMSQYLIRDKHRVTIHSADKISPDDIGQANMTLIGSCSWDHFEGTKRLEGQLQQHWIELKKKVGSRTYPQHNFAIFGVGDSTYTHFCGAADQLEDLVKKWQGKQIGPTLRLDSYFFEQEARDREIRDWLKRLFSKSVLAK